MQETQRFEVVDRGMLCKAIARRLGMTISDVNEIIGIMQKEIQDDIREGKKVQLNGFLIFTPRDVEATELKSPLDGQVYKVGPKRTVDVKVGKEFKDSIKDGYSGRNEEKKEDDKTPHRRRTAKSKDETSE